MGSTPISDCVTFLENLPEEQIQETARPFMWSALDELRTLMNLETANELYIEGEGAE